MTTHGATDYERLLFEDLKEETDLGLRRVAISEAEDPFGDAVWHILLLLDPPSGPAGSWDPVATGALKAQAGQLAAAVSVFRLAGATALPARRGAALALPSA